MKELIRKVTCPVCSGSVDVTVTKDMIEGKKQFPVSIKVYHGEHHFYVNLDSQGSITDILHPDLVE